MIPVYRYLGGWMDDAVRRAVELAPGSLRQLALEAGIDPSLLTRFMAGHKGVSLATAQKLAAALERWRDRCAQAADLIHNATLTDGGKDA